MEIVFDMVIVGAGPGGMAAALHAEEKGLKAVVLERGKRVCQGIIDSYPRGKKVYPTIPRGWEEPFLAPQIQPSNERLPVEEYVAKVEKVSREVGVMLRFNEEFTDISHDNGLYRVKTGNGFFEGKNVILAFGSNVPNELGIWGEARTVARSLDSPEDYVGVPCLVLGGGDAAADNVAALSRAKRDAGDPKPVYWAHPMESFTVDKDVARDLGEEILLGGNIKIMQGAIPRIGQVDDDGVERLVIQTQTVQGEDIVYLQGLSFPMKNVIACIGSHGPEPIFTALGLNQLTCMSGACKIGKEGSKLLVLDQHFQSSQPGMYVIGGAISPVYMQASGDGTFKETKHSNLIYMAINDGVKAVKSICGE